MQKAGIAKGIEREKTEDKDRVRQNTANEINRIFEDDIADSIREFSTKSKKEISQRLEQLEKEWDIERVLEANASTLAFTGLVLGNFFNKKWLVIPGLVLPFLFQHAVQGWCPPIPILRRFGVRT